MNIKLLKELERCAANSGGRWNQRIAVHATDSAACRGSNLLALACLAAVVAGGTTTLAQPVITQELADVVVTNGGTAAFTVVATSSAPATLTYDWWFNGSRMPGFISTVAGNGIFGSSGDGGTATAASLAYPAGVAVDHIGNVLIADSYIHRVRKVATNGTISTVAGNGTYGFSGDGGAATAASVASPVAVAVDALGCFYVSDFGNHRIRKVDTNGLITTLAGNGTAGFNGDGGLARAASLNMPQGLAVDHLGNLFITDSQNHRIRKVDSNGIITTVAGSGTIGFSGDGGAATAASLALPAGVAVDSQGRLFIADEYNGRIRRVDTNGIITTLAGNAMPGFSGDGGPAAAAYLNHPLDVALDGLGNLLIADAYNQRVRKVDTHGIISTFAGSGATGYAGDGNLAASAAFNYPVAVEVDVLGNVFIADESNYRIRQVPARMPSLPSLTLASATTNSLGNYIVVVSDSTGSVTSRVARLDMPPFIASQPASRTMVPGALVTLASVTGGSQPLFHQWTLNGTNLVGATTAGYTIAAATEADAGSYQLTVSNAFGLISSSNIVLTLSQITQQPTSQTIAGGGTASFSVGMSGGGPFSYQWRFNGVDLPTSGTINAFAGTGGYGFSGDGGPAPAATLAEPSGSVRDRLGNVYIADRNNHRVRKVDTAGVITTFAGRGTSGSAGDGGPATNAYLYSPYAVAVDAIGAVLIADSGNHRIRRVGTNGLISTIAGKGTYGFSGDGNQATNASLYAPKSVALDSAGNLFIADSGNHRIRRVGTNGVIATVAGYSTAGFTGDGDLAVSAQLNGPASVSVDGAGNLIIADTGNRRVRRVGADGIIRTLAGNGSSGTSGDGGMATNAALGNLVGVVADPAGNVFVTDSGRIRQVGVNGMIWTVAGTGSSSATGDGGVATNAGLGSVLGVSVDESGTLLIAANSRIRKVVGNPAWPPTLATLVMNGASVAQVGEYSVVVHSSGGSITSSVAILTVTVPPVITQQPTNCLVGTGASASFGVSALGSGPFDFALVRNGALAVQHGTNRTFTLTNVTTNDAGDYTIIVTNPYGSATSQVATLTVAVPPILLIEPANQTNSTGSTGMFTVTAAGIGPFRYQWRCNGTNLPNQLITTIAGSGLSGYGGDGGPATNAQLSGPQGLAFDAVGNLLIADRGNHRVRRITPGGVISTIAGRTGAGSSGDGGPATNAFLFYPAGVVADATGNVLIADTYNNRVRAVDTNGLVATVAGSASLAQPTGILLGADGSLYVSDTGHDRIVNLTVSGLLTRCAGTGSHGYAGDGGAATNAWLSYPIGLAWAPGGRMLIADSQNNRIRKVDSQGMITTIAGTGGLGSAGDGGPATNAQLSLPQDVAADAEGNVFITDKFNHRVRKVDPHGIITTVAGKGLAGFSGDGGPATNATFYGPAGLTFDAAGNLYVADSNNHRIRKLHLAGVPTLVVSNLALAHAGDYSVVVSSPYGSVTSKVATLTVIMPPRLGIGGLSNGLLTLQFTGVPGAWYQIQSATNLAPPPHWQPEQTIQTAADGWGQFTATNAIGARKFYRVMME